jgi:hypothetical protein
MVELFLLVQAEKDLGFVAQVGGRVRGRVSFAAALEFERGFDVLLHFEKVKNIRRDCFAIELIVKIAAASPRSILEPPVVPLLHEIALNKIPDLLAKIEQVIVQQCFLQVRRALEFEERVKVKHISHVVLV